MIEAGEEINNSPTIVSGGEDDLRQFMQEIHAIPRLTVEEERQLARRCAEGDQEAIRKMVSSNMRLVVSVAREYSGRGVPMLDLIQEGAIGLLAAAKKFDYQRDLRFSTYATKWISQGVTRCLTLHGGLIRVPMHTAERMRKLQALRSQYIQVNGEPPSLSWLAERMELSQDKIQKLLDLIPETCSLDAPAGEEEDSTMGALLADQTATEPYAELVRAELTELMDRLMSQIHPRQQQVIRLHYGMDDGVCHSLEEISRRLGVSKERVRQIEQAGIQKLQKLGLPLGLEDFLD